uniref:THO complex subunit 1 n=1 Tax=Phallusia mammillata TaxID=59560 RepID=A0A6F9DVP7_9ASCI|nr:THO complex subunit 1 [Phallusia mammillata]
MATEFLFEKSRQSFKETLLTDIKKKNFETVTQFIELYSSYTGSDPEKRTVSDQTLRDLLQEKISKKNVAKSSTAVADILNIITVSVSVAKQGFCTPSMPFILLGDVLDCYTLDLCDKVFQYIEDRVSIWKSSLFYQAGKNYLLRMCNDLLRRLSQSQNTVFCGRIQLFLARLFPLSEKSALNLVSQFNLDNITIFNKTADGAKSEKVDEVTDKDEIMDVDAIDVNAEENDLNPPTNNNEIIDYKLYNDIWSLQDMFRYPVQCYNKDLWEKFVKHADCLFKVFSSFKLEDTPGSRGSTPGQQAKTYFSKFLTSEKLTNLQLNDSMFRRQILTQFLILFQYLSATVKFKSNNMILSENQKNWINDTTKKIYKILDETPPHGKEFSKYIKHILDREDYWIAWKNDSCPSFMKLPDKASSQAPAAKKRKIEETVNSIGDDFVAGKPLGMGSPELTRLWNLCPNNLDACRSSQREFVPSLKDYFAESIEQEDPKNQIEEQYKLVKNSNFQWKALRLLSKRSQLFFMSQPPLMQFKTVPDYLTTITKKLEKEFPSNATKVTSAPSTPKQDAGNVELSQENEKTDLALEDDSAVKDPNDEGDDGVLDEDGSLGADDNLMDENQDDVAADTTGETAEAATALDTLSSEDITTFATKIAAEWKKLAPHLNISAKDIKEIEEDSEDAVLQARQTLVTWQDFEKSKASYSNLIQAMKAAGLENLTKDV